MKALRSATWVALGASLALRALAQGTPTPAQQLREIYKELVEINTADSAGSCTAAAEAMAARLKAGGLPARDVQVIVPPGGAKKGNLVARYRGTGAKKPVMLLGHLDVVEAKREDWQRDPFRLVEENGYFYARGASDDKAMVAVFIANLIRYRQEGYRPERDLILVATCDEEIVPSNFSGIVYLLKNHRNLIDAEFALNEGAGVGLKNGKALRHGLQTSEKGPVNYRLEVKNAGGHSSLPVKDNAIYRLAEGLARLSKFDFPVKLNETTRLWFERSAATEEAQSAADMKAVAAGRADAAAIGRLSAKANYNAQLRTTCVATMLEGGHASNALPQSARATVNCRVLPGEPIEELEKALRQVLADEQISLTRTSEFVASPPSPLRPEILQPIEKLTAQFWPGIPVIPSMSAGATDGRYLRNAGIATYGHSGLAGDVDDNRAHGRDERVGVKAFDDGLEYLYRLVKTLSSGSL